MKKVFGLIIALLLSTSCDDGEITLQSFDFDNQIIQKCSDKTILFKTKNEELLLISLPQATYDSAFDNTETGDTPREVTINTSNKVIYRKYSGTVSSTTICSDLPPATPTVSKEWIATGGTMIVETNYLYDTDGVTIIGSTHNITFQNISFSSGEDSFSFVSYIFGNYETN
ncbi:hypothetical protein [Flavobacterium okayamense]|uniref:Lipoprotein n=1 Tax=Flavobacterium okayamense TaxID=2830782 RepID=A0ABN6HYP1_9FLAO|nr:hypothetical protein [Flavobacterium okayamense]BCY28865.1 hypothetical protein KK2020170_17330 [Flavobacterium okayamense]